MHIFLTLLNYAFALFYLILGCIAAYLVYRDRKSKAENIWHPGKRSLGPLRWALIMLLTGGLAIGLYWFLMYQKTFLQLAEASRKSGNQSQQQ